MGRSLSAAAISSAGFAGASLCLSLPASAALALAAAALPLPFALTFPIALPIAFSSPYMGVQGVEERALQGLGVGVHIEGTSL